MVSRALPLSPHPKMSPSPPYPFHGGVPHLGEVLLGTVVLLDGGHYQQRQEVLSLGGAGLCSGPWGPQPTCRALPHLSPLPRPLLLTMVVYTRATTAAATSAMKMRRRIRKN